MDYSDYLREQAAKYRQLAETAEDPSVKREILELAAVCEEVANEIDDRRTSGLRPIQMQSVDLAEFFICESAALWRTSALMSTHFLKLVKRQQSSLTLRLSKQTA
jgi:hypothetical protein